MKRTAVNNKDIDMIADIILKNAKFYTLDDTQPWADCVAIEDGTIIFVGAYRRSYAGHCEQNEGSIQVGKFADLIVLSDNLLEIDPNEIPNANVEMTMVQGKFVFQSESE